MEDDFKGTRIEGKNYFERLRALRNSLRLERKKGNDLSETDSLMLSEIENLMNEFETRKKRETIKKGLKDESLKNIAREIYDRYIEQGTDSKDNEFGEILIARASAIQNLNKLINLFSPVSEKEYEQNAKRKKIIELLFSEKDHSERYDFIKKMKNIQKEKERKQEVHKIKRDLDKKYGRDLEFNEEEVKEIVYKLLNLNR